MQTLCGGVSHPDEGGCIYQHKLSGKGLQAQTHLHAAWKLYGALALQSIQRIGRRGKATEAG